VDTWFTRVDPRSAYGSWQDVAVNLRLAIFRF